MQFKDSQRRVQGQGMTSSTSFTVGSNDGHAAQRFHRLSQGTDAGRMDAIVVCDHYIHFINPFQNTIIRSFMTEKQS
jgi:hypothetical protein